VATHFHRIAVRRSAVEQGAAIVFDHVTAFDAGRDRALAHAVHEVEVIDEKAEVETLGIALVSVLAALQDERKALRLWVRDRGSPNRSAVFWPLLT
jgi:hypothetical protein